MSTDHCLTFEEIKRQTHLAYLVAFRKRGTSEAREVWIPKSTVLRIDLEAKELSLPEWLVEKQDLWDWSI